MKIKYAAIVLAFFIINCATEEDGQSEEEFSFGQLVVGDKWEMEVSDKEIQNASFSAEVKSTNVSYNSNDCYELELKGFVGSLSIDDTEMENIQITTKLFIRTSDFEEVWSEFSMEGTMTDESGDAFLFKSVSEASKKLTGSNPSTISVGKTWTLKAEVDEATKIYVDNQLVDNSDTSYTETSNYEATAIKSVSVPAGDFSSVEVKYEEVESGDYGFEYYSNSAKYIVKETHYEDGKLTTTSELKTLIKR